MVSSAPSPRLTLGEGQLRAALRQLGRQRFRPPGRTSTHCYSMATLERWYHRVQLLYQTMPEAASQEAAT
jgi:hypothetical protein